MLRTLGDDIQALRHTSRLARASAAKLAARISLASCPATSAFTLDDLHLPTTEPIISQLIPLGVDASLAQRISSTLSEATYRLRRLCETDYRDRCLQLAKQPYFAEPHAVALVPSTYATLFQKTVSEWSSYILNNFTPRLLAAYRNLHRRAQSPAKRPFNHGAIPMLERFFAENAFPSRLEKYELASQCDMDYRQIHVWNRRSRLRKDGIELKRRQASDELLGNIAKSLDALLPGSPDEEDDPDESSNRVHDDPYSALAPGFKAPAHAFPSPYPPLCAYDPFPIGKSLGFELPWPRTCNPQPLRAQSQRDVNVTDLVRTFADLCIEDSHDYARKVDSTERNNSTTERLPDIGRAIRCPRAPLPALIRPYPSATWPSYSAYRSSACHSPSTRHSIHSATFGSTSRLSSPSPCLAIDAAASRRAPRRTLPRRLPKHPPSRGSVRVQSPRSTSISSDCWGSESDPDSPLSTPPFHPVDLLLSSKSVAEGVRPVPHDASSKILTLDSFAFDAIISNISWDGSMLAAPPSTDY
ncbi:hypothetical protein ONZ51_g11667 [Trametes cubensis]|uniref:Homeobox domain-containing protein n=1 Tax=Trametes cubensis TaxID=1111947 RepID=A0AAD7TH47_9APHY|nr:hypothetical protein ONZ51_g11667 [Trametes cubensis]